MQQYFRDTFENLFSQENLYLGPFAIIERIRESEMIFRFPNYMTHSRINIFKVLTVSRARGTIFDIKVINNFIEIKYNRFSIFITNEWYFTILEIIRYG